MFTDHKKALVSAQRLPKYCQQPNRNSRNISKDIWNFSHNFKIFIYIKSRRTLVRKPWIKAWLFSYRKLLKTISLKKNLSPVGLNFFVSTIKLEIQKAKCKIVDTSALIGFKEQTPQDYVLTVSVLILVQLRITEKKYIVIFTAIQIFTKNRCWILFWK